MAAKKFHWRLDQHQHFSMFNASMSELITISWGSFCRMCIFVIKAIQYKYDNLDWSFLQHPLQRHLGIVIVPSHSQDFRHHKFAAGLLKLLQKTLCLAQVGRSDTRPWTLEKELLQNIDGFKENIQQFKQSVPSHPGAHLHNFSYDGEHCCTMLHGLLKINSFGFLFPSCIGFWDYFLFAHCLLGISSNGFKGISLHFSRTTQLYPSLPSIRFVFAEAFGTWKDQWSYERHLPEWLFHWKCHCNDIGQWPSFFPRRTCGKPQTPIPKVYQRFLCCQNHSFCKKSSFGSVCGYFGLQNPQQM